MKYHHLGIPTKEKRSGEIHLEDLKIYVSGLATSSFGVEWIRYEDDAPYPDIVKNLPHVAFEVDTQAAAAPRRSARHTKEARLVDEAHMEETDNGKSPANDGWFVLHVADAPWLRSERFGSGCRVEGNTRFPEIGFNLRVLEPGKPACLYHRESAQEDFLVLSGECTLVVEEQERQLRAGHFVHCPAETNHVFVGGGEGPCVVLMIGHRPEQVQICYPVSEAAARHGAAVSQETADPREAYGEMPLDPIEPIWPLFGP